MEKEIIKVTDRYGFIYGVVIKYYSHLGFSIALYEDKIIGCVEYGRIYKPLSDVDKEWEEYEEKLEGWKCDVKINIIPKCEEYFNKYK